MNINDIRQRKHLKPYDLQGKEPVVTIARFDRLQLGWGPTKGLKPVLFFVNKEKYLILNATMLDALAAIAGPETDRWPGMVVQLFTTTDKDPKKNGEQVPVIRIKAPTRIPQLVKAGGIR